MKRRKPEERGFALLIVVLLVALLALTGAALLDVVNVDISIAGEHSKVVRAQTVSDGALREVLADVETTNQLPDFTACAGDNGGTPVNVNGTNVCPNYRYNWANEIGGAYIKNPDDRNFPSEPLNEDNSAYARFTGSPSEENYTATIDLLRMAPVQDTSLQVARAVVFEANTTGKVAGNTSRAINASEIYRLTIRPQDALPPRLHAR
jgi:hypothetical protein